MTENDNPLEADIGVAEKNAPMTSTALTTIGNK